MAQVLFRRFIVALSLLAFMATGIAPAMAMADAPIAMKAMSMSTTSNEPTPCCPDKAACVTDVGCIFLVGLPMPHLTVSTALGWSSLAYEFSHDRGEGLSIRPALGPPILPA